MGNFFKGEQASTPLSPRLFMFERSTGTASGFSSSLEGKILGDKGYISETSSWELAQRNLNLITKKRKNMVQQNSKEEEILLKKRGTIESVIEKIKFVFHSWHTRHRSILNAFANLYAGIIAYALKPQKPSFALNA